jgi:DNA polymerase-1
MGAHLFFITIPYRTNAMKKILIIDFLNLFIRSYVTNPSVSKNGDPIGGIVGTFKSLQKICRETNPNIIIICHDGPNGSLRKKVLNKAYKEGRNPLRLNRNIKALDEKQEFENRLWQQFRTFEYLNLCPIIQIMEENIEADDLVSYVCQYKSYNEYVKLIVSSDKDFIQLLNDKTLLVRPIQDEVLNKKRIIEEFSIHPNNFALARAIVGDKSDNLDGVRGVGLITIAKKFPFLIEEQRYTVNDILENCEKNKSTNKVFENIIVEKDKIELNYKIMQLSSPNMSIQSQIKTSYILDNFTPDFNKTEFLKMSILDGFADLNIYELFAIFNRIIHDHNSAT